MARPEEVAVVGCFEACLAAYWLVAAALAVHWEEVVEVAYSDSLAAYWLVVVAWVAHLEEVVEVAGSLHRGPEEQVRSGAEAVVAESRRDR